MGDPLLRINGLRVDFDNLVAVNDLSLELEPGDVFGLIGPNGAGKTTTMRAVAGLQPASRGAIRVVNIDVTAQPREARTLVGFMPDVSPLYDKLTVEQFLDHYARAGDIGDRAARIDICLQMTWLTEKRTALCDSLSRGMKQRLILARTLLTDPPVLLLDEPASGIDPVGRIELRKLLLDLQRMGKAIVLSSHILTEMSGFCNKVGIMEKGRLVRSGRVNELVSGLRRRPTLVRWRGNGADAIALLRSIHGVTNLNPQDAGAVFEFEGDDEGLDAILPQLCAGGVRVTEWRHHGDDLEHLLLESGAKAVS